MVDEKKEQEKVVKWKDLDQEQIYKIILIEGKVSKYGDSYLNYNCRRGKQSSENLCARGYDKEDQERA